jgi:intracellular sulfur oxidation DsrE/DsrF family protein
MESNDQTLRTPRREFLGALATGAVAMSIGTLATPLSALAGPIPTEGNMADDPDAWFNKIKGKHRVVFDCVGTNEVFPFAWPAVFMMTNEATGTPAKDQGIVVVLRHAGIPYAMEDRLWAKYHFDKFFGASELGPAFTAADAKTATATRNPFWKPKMGDFNVPGIGPVAIGLNDLQEKGVMFCVCNAALTVYSAAAAMQTGQKPEDVKKDWMSGLLPGVQVVPSGVWALGRAQEHNCAYIFTGA